MSNNNCYPNFRTPFDRMMQSTYASCCLPKPQCLKHGKPLTPPDCDVRKCGTSLVKKTQSDNAKTAPSPSVEFYAESDLDVVVLAPDWCGYSKKLSAQTQELKKLLYNHGANVHVLTNADDPIFKSVSKMLGVKGFPHSVVLKNKIPVKQASGYKAPHLLVAELMS